MSRMGVTHSVVADGGPLVEDEATAAAGGI